MNEIITDAIGKALDSTGYVLLEAVLQPAMIPVLIALCGLIFLRRTIPR